MPTFEWIGKNKVINHHQEVPYRVLERKYSFDENGQHEEDNDSENMIIKGDNLEALKALLPRYEGRIKCIYIDPPYNTGYEGWVYNDNVNDPKIKKWLGEVVGKEGEDLSRHDKWLCMMYPRLKLLQKLLADDGAIFISIDDNEQANLKLICDEIFGINNFVAQIPWHKRTAKSDVPFGISQDCESILCYAKTDLFVGAIEGNNRKYYLTSDFPDNPWRTHDLTTQRTITERPNSNFTIINPKTGDKYPVNPLRSWAVTKDTFNYYYNENRIIFPGDYDFLNISNPVFRYWKKDDMQKAGDNFGNTAVSTFLPTDIVGMTQDGTKEITDIFGEKIFNFPKPSSLIHFIIKLATLNNKDAIILDSFAGSGTTAHALLNLNKQDGGNRKFILIELSDYANTITAERVKRVINGYNTKNTVQLFEKKITATNLRKGSQLYEEALKVYEENKKLYDDVKKPKVEKGSLIVTAKNREFTPVAGTGGDFSYYELGEPLLVDDCLNEAVPVEKIREYIWFIETKAPFITSTNDNQYYLGQHNDTGYYFYYEPQKITALDYSFLATIKEKASNTVIYADRCSIGVDKLMQMGITFKKIPRDISKL